MNKIDGTIDLTDGAYFCNDGSIPTIRINRDWSIDEDDYASEFTGGRFPWKELDYCFDWFVSKTWPWYESEKITICSDEDFRKREYNNDIINNNFYGDLEYPFIMGSSSDRTDGKKYIERYLGEERGQRCIRCGKRINVLNAVFRMGIGFYGGADVCTKCDKILENESGETPHNFFEKLGTNNG